MEDKKTQYKQIILKLLISILVIIAIVVISYLVMRYYGITNLTKEQLQEYIISTGAIAPLVFIGVSFAQVTLIPIPGAITILAGSYLFGFWQSFLYSYVGMMIGAVASFALGRLIGRPYVNWVAGGKKKAEEWIKKLHGQENVFLFFAFLLPLFPDDILCAVAGALPVKWFTFILMQIFTRATSIGCTLVFMSGQVIPFQGWGLVVIAVVMVIGIIAFILSLKYAEKINEFFSKFINKIVSRKNKGETNDK